MRPGPKRTTTNPYAKQYEEDPAGFKAGVTIAEYEAARGWPLFTVWPEAEAARGPDEPGWFLYCNANDEERAYLGAVQLHALVRPRPAIAIHSPTVALILEPRAAA